MTDKLDKLKKLPLWTAWRYIERVNRGTGEVKRTKPPVNAGYDPAVHSSDMGSNADPSTWFDYDTVKNYLDAHPDSTDGMGIVFANGLAGVDLDHVRNPDTGEIIPEALEIVKALNTYTEVSPSGTGLHMLIWLDESAGYTPQKKKSAFVTLADGTVSDIEAYTNGRYFTVTEHPLDGYDIPIREDKEAALADFKAVVDRYLLKGQGEVSAPPARKETPPSPPSSSPPLVFTPPADDNALWDRMFHSKNGAQIKRLFDNTEPYPTDKYPSKSEVDLALIQHLVYWTNGDSARIDRMFRQSQLYDDKWDTHKGAYTYGQITIHKGINSAKRYDKQGEPAETEAEAIPDDPGVQSHYYPTLSNYRTAYTEHRQRGFRPYRTPFPALDKLLGGGLYPELYVLGAATGSGKTSLVLQIGDYIAHSGIPVLYTALEMSLDELIAKSISRLSYDVTLSEDADGNTPYSKQARSTNEILWHHADTDAVKLATERYFTEYAPHIGALEGVGNISTGAIRLRAKTMADATGKAPLVVVDYLQLLASDNPYGTEKQAADHNVTALKQLSRELTCPVFLISSLNRMSTKEIKDNDLGTTNGPELESFKESGGIEYTAGVAIGMWNKTIQDGEEHKVQTTLRLLKHRHFGIQAGNDKVELEFLGRRSMFEPWNKEEPVSEDDVPW